MDNKVVAIELKNITKRFGKVYASKDVSLKIYQGEILALLGENGSGKTSLMNILAGIYYPDKGGIYFSDFPVNITNPNVAYAFGIGMVHQHYKLIEVFTALENLVLGFSDEAIIDYKKIKEKVQYYIEKYGFDIDLNKKVFDMSVSEKQTLEIVKVLLRGTEVLILDEPTAVLTPQEITKLFATLKAMKEDNKTVIIITHKLQEILTVSDRVAILRKGELTGVVDTNKANESILTDLMVGEHIDLKINRDPVTHTGEALSVNHLTVLDAFNLKALDDVCFTLNIGEILGVAGVAGNGQRELLESIAGLYKVNKGTEITFIDGDKKVDIVSKDPREIKKLGISLAFVPEDRLGMGLVGELDLVKNVALRNFEEGHGIFFKRKKAEEEARMIVEELKVVTPSINSKIKNLSGGNIQKVLVGREIASSPKILMSAYASRRLDITTSFAIYNLFNEKMTKGSAVLYVGEDLDVLIALCDRIMVLYNGKVTGIVDARTTNKKDIGKLMAGLPINESEEITDGK